MTESLSVELISTTTIGGAGAAAVDDRIQGGVLGWEDRTCLLLQLRVVYDRVEGLQLAICKVQFELMDILHSYLLPFIC